MEPIRFNSTKKLTVSKINLIRYDVIQSTREATHAKRPFTHIYRFTPHSSRGQIRGRILASLGDYLDSSDHSSNSTLSHRN